jgi:hypothetical protein
LSRFTPPSCFRYGTHVAVTSLFPAKQPYLPNYKTLSRQNRQRVRIFLAFFSQYKPLFFPSVAHCYNTELHDHKARVFCLNNYNLVVGVCRHTPTRLWRWNRQCSETSVFKTQTPGNYPKEIKQHSEHGESLKSRITKNTAKVWNQELQSYCPSTNFCHEVNI